MNRQDVMNRQEVEAFVRCKYADRADKRGESITSQFMRLYDAHGRWADNNFDQALLGGNHNKFIQRYWEMVLADHLTTAGHPVMRTSAGPDFSFLHKGRKVWVEAVAPTASQEIYEFYAEEARKRSSYFYAPPFHLRWTQAIEGKSRKFLEDIEKRRVGRDDILVIAVNSSLLGHLGMTGQSHYPALVEVAYGRGTEFVSLDRDSLAIVDHGIREEPFIQKANKSLVAKRFFLDPAFDHISAIFASGISPSQWAPMVIAYNPFSTARFDQNWLAADFEYVAERCEDGYQIVLRSSQR